MVFASDDRSHVPSSAVIAQVDLLLRGGAIGLLMLAAVVFARAPASLPSRFGLALTLCTVVGTLAGLPHAPTAIDPLLDLSASAAIPLFWLFARAWFDDAFRPKPVDMALAAAFLGCTLYAGLQGAGLQRRSAGWISRSIWPGWRLRSMRSGWHGAIAKATWSSLAGRRERSSWYRSG
ncbi:hypothetical protein QP162_01870 [Sphingomonas aurantiaca]|uniref:hypothetical protein n=1 Tax=Sphingomonas aurantiaca TaxID=185949 RepID=UPI002FE213FA